MNQKSTKPNRGEIWTLNLDPTVGHEQGGHRPCLVVSADELNSSPAGVVIVLPITSTYKGIPSHIEVNPPEGGLVKRSFVKVEDLRSVSVERFDRRLGTVTRKTMEGIERIMRFLLGL